MKIEPYDINLSPKLGSLLVGAWKGLEGESFGLHAQECMIMMFSKQALQRSLLILQLLRVLRNTLAACAGMPSFDVTKKALGQRLPSESDGSGDESVQASTASRSLEGDSASNAALPVPTVGPAAGGFPPPAQTANLLITPPKVAAPSPDIMIPAWGVFAYTSMVLRVSETRAKAP